MKKLIIAALLVCSDVKADPPVIVHCDSSGVCVVINPATGEESIVVQGEGHDPEE